MPPWESHEGVAVLTYGLPLLCVAAIVAGQLLFKASAQAWQSGGTLLAVRPLLLFAIAVALFGLASLGWVWALRRGDLGRLYPLMALAFVAVPLASYFAFDERFGSSYFVGVALIVAGVVVAVRS
jgi:drug/metabolite transporter (DMT)-like permease